jgi:hypothetical protein
MSKDDFLPATWLQKDVFDMGWKGKTVIQYTRHFNIGTKPHISSVQNSANSALNQSTNILHLHPTYDHKMFGFTVVTSDWAVEEAEDEEGALCPAAACRVSRERRTYHINEEWHEVPYSARSLEVLSSECASHPPKILQFQSSSAVSGDSTYKEICAPRNCIYQHNETLPIWYKKKGRYCFSTSSIFNEVHTTQRACLQELIRMEQAKMCE